MPSTPEVALRKRQQIAKANRMMFMWIAGASVIIGFALVTAVFLFEKGSFNGEVLAIKAKTASTLKKNVDEAKALKQQILVRNTSQALRDVMAPGETEPIRVVLDALPSDANSSAFGASLQDKFLKLPGMKIESLSVDPTGSEINQAATGVEDAAATAPVIQGEIPFSFVVSVGAGEAGVLKDLLTNLERSIRTVHVQTVKLEQLGERLTLTVVGKAFFEPAVTAELTEKSISPAGSKKKVDKK